MTPVTLCNHPRVIEDRGRFLQFLIDLKDEVYSFKNESWVFPENPVFRPPLNEWDYLSSAYLLQERMLNTFWPQWRTEARPHYELPFTWTGFNNMLVFTMESFLWPFEAESERSPMFYEFMRFNNLNLDRTVLQNSAPALLAAHTCLSDLCMRNFGMIPNTFCVPFNLEMEPKVEFSRYIDFFRNRYAPAFEVSEREPVMN